MEQIVKQAIRKFPNLSDYKNSVSWMNFVCNNVDDKHFYSLEPNSYLKGYEGQYPEIITTLLHNLCGSNGI